MSKLLELQCTFTRLVASLIIHIYTEGYTATFGYTFRSPEECKRLSAMGLGINNSLHSFKLAVDLNLYKEGVWLTRSEDLTALGAYWKSLSTPGFECVWGGDFKTRPDGNHFSIAFNGVK